MKWDTISALHFSTQGCNNQFYTAQEYEGMKLDPERIAAFESLPAEWRNAILASKAISEARTDWCDALDRVTPDELELVFRYVVAERRRREPEGMPWWLGQACRFAERHRFEIPPKWVADLRAYAQLRPGACLESSKEWLEKYDKKETK